MGIPGIGRLQAMVFRRRRNGRSSAGSSADLQADGLLFTNWYQRVFLGDGASCNARDHFLRHWQEGHVAPNPTFNPLFLAAQFGSAFAEDPLGFSTTNEAKMDATSEWFSRRQYLRLHPDVAGHWSGPPEIHFLRHGLVEGRQPHPEFLVLRVRAGRPAAANRVQCVVHRFEWQNHRYEVVRNSIPQAITEQIRDQARHEIALFAAGDKAIPALRQIDASDLKARTGLDVLDLLRRAGDGCDAVVFIPWIQIGGGDRYVAELVREMREQFSLRILVIVSEWSEVETRRFARYKFLSSLFASRILAWREVVTDRNQDSWLAALLMNRLRPRFIFVANSDLGHTLLADYGRALTSFARCFPIFFSESPNAMGAPYSARYFSDVCLFSRTITDNDRMARTLRHRQAGLVDESVLVLPPTIDIESTDAFEARLRRRFANGSHAWRNRCVWIGRVEPFKGTDILLAIARLRKDLVFDIFGPASQEMQALLQNHHNIRYLGEFLSIDDIEFELYEFLLFPSLFEGMPNTVLEAVQYGLPVVTSDVGGLRETFSGTQIAFVELDDDAAESAARFVATIDRLQSLPVVDVESRIRQARAALLARHGRAAFAAGVRHLLDAR